MAKWCIGIGDSNGGGSDRGVIVGENGGDSGGGYGDNGDSGKVGSGDRCRKFGNYGGANNTNAFGVD